MSYDLKIHEKPCSDCKHAQELMKNEWICMKHLMGLRPDMYITYMVSRIDNKSSLCFEDV